LVGDMLRLRRGTGAVCGLRHYPTRSRRRPGARACGPAAWPPLLGARSSSAPPGRSSPTGAHSPMSGTSAARRASIGWPTSDGPARPAHDGARRPAPLVA